MTKRPKIELTSPRKTVEVHLPDGRVYAGPRGANAADFLKPFQDSNNPTVGAVINNQLRELTYPINMDAQIRPITMSEADGMRFYRRSLTFLLECAFHQLFPRAYLTIDHSVSSGGYFCQVFNRPALTEQELGQLEERMHELVAQDVPFKRQEVPLAEAIEYFRQLGHNDKVRLLKYRRKDHLVLYSLNGYRDYHHGYMVPSTGYLKWFALSPTTEDGFTLRFPRRHKPTELLPMPGYPTLLDTFRQYGDWLQRLGVDSVGALNDAIQQGRAQEIVLVAEALHEQRIAEIAGLIAARIQNLRVVLIAGPSSSGKTTFSKRLSIQLLARGISPFPLEMDNYFIDRELTPRDENGELDFEALQAVNTAQLGEDIQALITGKTVQLPHYDFKVGRSGPGERVQLQPGQIIILEGIHGLNPGLIPNIPSQYTFRIYASALTQLNLDRHNRISTTDTRLIRRIVRD
ncbi:MAG: nucleoside kinase, partial [Anaerolineales bacterium]|nr:nucleoside kinase [Anaerolineales bacterium]